MIPAQFGGNRFDLELGSTVEGARSGEGADGRDEDDAAHACGLRHAQEADRTFDVDLLDILGRDGGEIPRGVDQNRNLLLAEQWRDVVCGSQRPGNIRLACRFAREGDDASALSETLGDSGADVAAGAADGADEVFVS